MSGATAAGDTRPMPAAGSDTAAAREALAEALAEFLDPERVALALQLWRRRFEGDDSLFLRLTFYCREISQAHGLASHESALHMAMLRALKRSLPTSAATSTVNFDMLARPGLDTGARASASVSVSASVTAPLRRKAPAPELLVDVNLAALPEVTVVPQRSDGALVMQAFHLALETQLARQLPPGVTPARVRRTLIRHARSLPQAQRHAASLWWSGQATLLEGEWPPASHGTALVRVMSSGLTELLGASHAERCFKHAVARLEASKDSTLHAIRLYL